MTSPTNGDGVVSLLRETANAIAHLLSSHLKLLRLELLNDLTLVGRRATMLIGFGALTTIGYVLIALGIAASVQPVCGWAATLLILGALHFCGGGVGMLVVIKQLKALELFEHSTHAASDSANALQKSERENVPPEVDCAR